MTPDGFTPVFYTVSGKYRADLNKGTKKGVPIVLCFKTEDDEELFVQSKLGYVPGKGIDVRYLFTATCLVPDVCSGREDEPLLEEAA